MGSKLYKYLVQSQGGPLIAALTTKPTITEPTEILIRLKAIAINPADYKSIYQGHRVTSWPLVPGLDGAGIVEDVGDQVKRFAIGDEVLAMFTPGDRGASYQDYAVVQEGMVAKKPTTWSFEEAASLGVCYMTAITGLGIGLGLSLPFLPSGPTTTFHPSSIFVLGGSSALGAATIQLLRLALPSSTTQILTTSSTKHHFHLTHNLSADAAFDRSSPTLVTDIKSATGNGVAAIIDTVGAGRSERHVFDAFDPKGPKRYAQVWTGDEEIEAPDGVDSVMFRGRDLAGMPGGGNVMVSLQRLLEEGKYRLPLPVRRVEGQDVREALEKAVQLMRKGVSGEKLVVSI